MKLQFQDSYLPSSVLSRLTDHFFLSPSSATRPSPCTSYRPLRVAGVRDSKTARMYGKKLVKRKLWPHIPSETDTELQSLSYRVPYLLCTPLPHPSPCFRPLSCVVDARKLFAGGSRCRETPVRLGYLSEYDVQPPVHYEVE